MKSLFFVSPKIDLEEKVDFLILGGGVLGSSFALFLNSINASFKIIDASLPESGMEACGGLIKPSPLMGMSNKEIDNCLENLNCSSGLSEIQMILKPSGNRLKVNVFVLSMDTIRKLNKTSGTILEILPKEKAAKYYDNGRNKIIKISAKYGVLIALGANCFDFLPDCFERKKYKIKKGFSFHFEGQIDAPFVKFWAPFKQITIHNHIHDGESLIWAGEGSALLLKNWNDSRINEGLARIKKEIGNKLIRTIIGQRSFYEGVKPCFFKEIEPKVWLSTGSGKFGCISAGWTIEKIKERL